MSSLFARKFAAAATSIPYSGISAVIHRVVYFSRQLKVVPSRTIFTPFSLTAKKSGYPSLVSQFTTLPDDGNEKADHVPTPSEEDLMRMFEEWMVMYNKVYKSPEEKELRFSIFKKMIKRESVNFDINYLSGFACNTLNERKAMIMKPRNRIHLTYERTSRVNFDDLHHCNTPEE